LHHGELVLSSFNLAIEKELQIKFKHGGENPGAGPAKVEDLLLVLHYKFAS